MGSLLSRPRLVLAFALVLSAAGVLAWFQMPREEDPRLGDRFGQVVSVFPGANVANIERLVVRPLEDELAQVDELKSVEVTIRSSVAVFVLELNGDVLDTDEAWNDVRDALERGHRDAPEAVRAPVFAHELNRTESIVIAVRSSGDRLELAESAEVLKSAMLAVANVAEVNVTGDPGEQVSVLLDEARAQGLGIEPGALAAMIASRNAALPSGSLRVDGRQVPLQARSEFRSIDELAATPIPVGTQAALPLSSVADVRRTVQEPLLERARLDGEQTILVGIISQPEIDAVEFGVDVREALAEFELSHPELQLDEVAFQPDHVETRLAELGKSLALGVFIVAFVLLLSMGVRLGLFVAALVPLVTFASLAIYAALGGVLHQMAVAALVVSLGLLVDNAIVMSELIQQRLDEGVPAKEASRLALAELAWPLASATATTLASFVPMLLAPGSVGEFTRAIPVVVMITLSVSLVYALVVAPLLARFVLKPSTSKGQSRVMAFARKLGRFAVHRPKTALLVVLLLITASGSFVGGVAQDFFPRSDRTQLVVSVAMPEGTHLDATDDATRTLERFVERQAGVQNVLAVVGRSVPHFYYNLPRIPRASHLAQLVVSLDSMASLETLRTRLREQTRQTMPNALVIARRLEQGPPVPAPIGIRLSGHDLDALHAAAEQVQRVLRADPRTEDVRHDGGSGSPTLKYDVDDAEAGRRGLSRVQLASAFVGRTIAHPSSVFRGGEDPMPIVVRDPAGERMRPSALDAIQMPTPSGLVALQSMTRVDAEFAPSVIHRRDRQRTISVLAEVRQGESYKAIVADLEPTLAALSFDGVRRSDGGAVESSRDADAALGQFAPLAVLLLIGILLAQFDSFRKVAIVLLTAPLAVMGIWPGLFALNLPFGFVALLGAIALIGIVVNGAIVLIDLSARRVDEGAPLSEAIVDAVAQRTRPILLTTATTIAGLLPLLFSESTLWPPMAAAMISGLTIATALTLLAVPAAMRVLHRSEPAPHRSEPA